MTARAMLLTAILILVYTRAPSPLPPNVVKFDLEQIGIAGLHQVRDLWLRRNLGLLKSIAAEVPPHGCLLLNVS